jgi:nicotinamide mononucleotide (NMN) deamidase PncC/exonuclease III
MTFNVELLLNLYNFNESITDYSIDETKKENFKKLFQGIDIACIQETAIPTITPKYDVFEELSMYNLKRGVICKSHKLMWPKSKLINGDGSVLANAIYSKFDTTSDKTKKISQIGDKRCSSIIDVIIEEIPIKVASVHLLGGRFDNQASLKNNTYVDEKKAQLMNVISVRPDIICGDFNTKINMEHIKPSTTAYYNTLSKPEQPNSNVLSRWDKWIYMDEYNALLEEHGYKSIYLTGDFSDKNTSAFGGIVDYIYYKPSKLELVKSEIYDDKGVMEKQTNIRYRPILSDHFPVVATFRINKANELAPNIPDNAPTEYLEDLPETFAHVQTNHFKLINKYKKIAQSAAFDILKILDTIESNKWSDNTYIGHTLATAESLTAGLIMSTLVDIPWGGYLKYGCFGVYNTDAKRTFLSVKVDDVYTHQCAEEMAIGTLNNSNATIAIAVTGNAMPLNPTHSGNTMYQGLGEVFIGIAGYDTDGKIICRTTQANACHSELFTTCRKWIQKIDDGIGKHTKKNYAPIRNSRHATSTVSQCIRYIVVKYALDMCGELFKTGIFNVPKFVLDRKTNNSRITDGLHINIPLDKYELKTPTYGNRAMIANRITMRRSMHKNAKSVRKNKN